MVNPHGMRSQDRGDNGLFRKSGDPAKSDKYRKLSDWTENDPIHRSRSSRAATDRKPWMPPIARREQLSEANGHPLIPWNSRKWQRELTVWAFRPESGIRSAFPPDRGGLSASACEGRPAMPPVFFVARSHGPWPKPSVRCDAQRTRAPAAPAAVRDPISHGCVPGSGSGAPVRGPPTRSPDAVAGSSGRRNLSPGPGMPASGGTCGAGSCYWAIHPVAGDSPDGDTPWSKPHSPRSGYFLPAASITGIEISPSIAFPIDGWGGNRPRRSSG